MAKAGRGSDQFVVRLPEGLRDHIKARAEAMGRSMNAEIIFRLEEFEKMIGEVERAERHASQLESDLLTRNRADQKTFEEAFIEGMERLARIEKKLDAKSKK